MVKRYHNPEVQTPTPESSAGEWVSAAFGDPNLDILTAAKFDPTELYAKSVSEGRTVAEQVAADHAHDEGVAHKNRLLGILAELVDDNSSQVADLLTMLDKQAAGSDRPEEARQRQFMGLWDLLSRVAQDEELATWLKHRSDDA